MQTLSDSFSLKNLKVCLFGDEIGWMENFEEKMGRKTFLVGVWLEGGKGKIGGGPGVFSPDSPKCFLSKMERKKSGRNLIDK